MMDRLTTDKKTSEMNMTELALNSCYVKNGEAWYRDYDTDISIRNLIREIYKNIDIEMPEDDEDFDACATDDLEFDLNTDVGLIALLYRNLWAMAELREKLKKYEDLEEQRLLLRLPCKVGDKVWFIEDNKIIKPMTIETICVSNSNISIWHVWHKFDLDDFGKTVFLTREEAEQKLKEMEG